MAGKNFIGVRGTVLLTHKNQNGLPEKKVEARQENRPPDAEAEINVRDAEKVAEARQENRPRDASFDRLKEKVRRFPELPGVYLLKDKNDRIIYVGKALSLRQRVRSYLADNESLSPRLRSLQARLAGIDYVVTDTEVEALILECNLIKEYRPRFNVNLKDDKDYPYLILTAEHYPRMELLRLSQKSGRRGHYRPSPEKEERRFGPYTNVGAVRETMRLLGTIFPLRRCRQPLDGNPSSSRPCLNFQMKRCLAPCRGEAEVSPADYDRVVKQIILFLQGRYNELESKLKLQMEEAAREQRFEEAAGLRDRLLALQRVAGQQQKMLSAENSIDRDVLALARLGRRSAVHLFQIRDGKLLSQEHFTLTGTDKVDDDEVMASFIKSYYNRAEIFPVEILASGQPADSELISRWLKLKAGRKVDLRVPHRGSLKKLIELARRNCLLRLQEEEEQRMRMTEQPLQELAHLLGLSNPPERIEGYDISHLRGGEPVGAMVVFRNGKPSKEDYRRFNIRKAPSGDDYAALQELLQRRAGQKNWPEPALILIDGGKGQLNSVREALHGTILAGIPLAALAKNPDRLFLEASPLPVLLAADNTMLQLLQRIRDEVHRFAVAGHRLRRSRSSIHSLLEEIPGVGQARRKALLDHLGSVEEIRQASIERLREIPGISSSLAAVIYQHLHEDE
jgi:excinuclease ABC subunit C